MNADGSAPGPAPIKVPVCSGLPQTGTNWNLEVPFRSSPFVKRADAHLFVAAAGSAFVLGKTMKALAR